jgi:hypothetical protein
MRVALYLGLPFLLGLAAWCGQVDTAPVGQEGKETVLEVTGKTRPVPGRLGIIAPAVLHPVVAVMVSPGDRVEKGQPLVKLDDDEPRADVRAKKAALAELRASLARLKAEPRRNEVEETEAALERDRIFAKAARQLVERLERAWNSGAISDQSLDDAKAGPTGRPPGYATPRTPTAAAAWRCPGPVRRCLSGLRMAFAFPVPPRLVQKVMPQYTPKAMGFPPKTQDCCGWPLRCLTRPALSWQEILAIVVGSSVRINPWRRSRGPAEGDLGKFGSTRRSPCRGPADFDCQGHLRSRP